VQGLIDTAVWKLLTMSDDLDKFIPSAFDSVIEDIAIIKDMVKAWHGALAYEMAGDSRKLERPLGV
jgi:hypothetical protein